MTLVAVSSPIPNWLEVIREEVGKNRELQELVQKVQEGEALGPWQYKEGMLFYKDRIFLQENSPLISAIIEQIHGDSMRAITIPSNEYAQIFIGEECETSSKNSLGNATCANARSSRASPLRGDHGLH